MWPAGNAHWAELSPLFAHRARPTPLRCKNKYMVLALGEDTVVQAAVGSIVRAFRRLKKPRYREMSARGYVLHRVCPQHSFLPSFFPSFLPSFKIDDRPINHFFSLFTSVNAEG